MNSGIKIVSKERFDSIFCSIFKHTQGLVWLFDDDSFIGLPDSECEELDECSHLVSETGFWGTVTHYGKWGKLDLFPRYSKFINEDWNDIYGSSQLELDWGDWYTRKSQIKQVAERAKFIQEHCDFYFINVDAAFWEFYCKKREIMDKLKDALKTMSNVKVTETKMSESHSI